MPENNGQNVALDDPNSGYAAYNTRCPDDVDRYCMPRTDWRMCEVVANQQAGVKLNKSLFQELEGTDAKIFD